MRERVAEEAADAQRDVDPRPTQTLERNHRQIVDTARLRIPDRLDAEQRQHLGDVVALRAHLRGAPGAEADHLRDSVPPRARGARAPRVPVADPTRQAACDGTARGSTA